MALTRVTADQLLKLVCVTAPKRDCGSGGGGIIGIKFGGGGAMPKAAIVGTGFFKLAGGVIDMDHSQSMAMPMALAKLNPAKPLPPKANPTLK